jgi:hypothetical protein
MLSEDYFNNDTPSVITYNDRIKLFQSKELQTALTQMRLENEKFFVLGISSSSSQFWKISNQFFQCKREKMRKKSFFEREGIKRKTLFIEVCRCPQH